MKTLGLIVLIVVTIAASIGAADNTSALVGTWKLRIDRSNMRPTQIKTEVAVITQKDTVTWHYSYDFVYNDGTTRHNEVDRIFDGMERPAANQRVEVGEHWDELNWVSRQTKDGKIASEIHSTISGDHKTQTVHRTTVNDKETIKEDIVFERVN